MQQMQVTARTIGRVISADSTIDGRQVLVTVEIAGQPERLAIKAEDMFRLMALLSMAAGGTTRAKGLPPGVRHVFPAESVGLRPAAEPDSIVIDVEVPGGLVLAFLLSAGQSQGLAEGIGGRSPSDGPIDPEPNGLTLDGPAELIVGPDRLPEAQRSAHRTAESRPAPRRLWRLFRSC